MSAFLFSIGLRSLGVAALGLLLLLLVRRRSAAIRHLVAAGTLIGILCLPVANMLLPQQSLPEGVAQPIVRFMPMVGLEAPKISDAATRAEATNTTTTVGAA